jgi:hypothetical protein
MEMLKINIGGELRPVHFGVNQTILYCETKGITISDYDKDVAAMASGNISGRETRLLLWSCLVDGARLSGVDFDADEQTVGDWMDEVDPDEVQKAIDDFAKQMVKKGKSNDNAKKK